MVVVSKGSVPSTYVIPSVTPVSRDLMPSSNLLGTSTHVVNLYTCGQDTYKSEKNISKERKMGVRRGLVDKRRLGGERGSGLVVL